MPGAKNFCFTLFNLELKDKFVKYNYKYMIMGEEICPSTGKIHLQGYWEFRSTKEFSVLKKHFPTVHFESRKGTQKQAIDYCKKDNKFEEFGDLDEDNQGKRTDLISIKDNILKGLTNCDEIAMTDPYLFHMYSRTLSKVEDIAMRKKFRTEMTLGFWLWGETGSGKSHTAYKDFSPETHYVLNLNDKGWWEGYAQQETVIINEFRGQIPYCELLDLIDKYPKSVPRRGREPLPFISKKIIITSSMPPDEVYHNLSITDSLEQLKRRIKIIEVRSGQEVILDS